MIRKKNEGKRQKFVLKDAARQKKWRLATLFLKSEDGGTVFFSLSGEPSWPPPPPPPP